MTASAFAPKTSGSGRAVRRGGTNSIGSRPHARSMRTPRNGFVKRIGDRAMKGTTDQRPRWEGPPENRPSGYLPAVDDPARDKDAAGIGGLGRLQDQAFKRASLTTHRGPAAGCRGASIGTLSICFPRIGMRLLHRWERGRLAVWPVRARRNSYPNYLSTISASRLE